MNESMPWLLLFALPAVTFGVGLLSRWVRRYEAQLAREPGRLSLAARVGDDPLPLARAAIAEGE